MVRNKLGTTFKHKGREGADTKVAEEVRAGHLQVFDDRGPKVSPIWG